MQVVQECGISSTRRSQTRGASFQQVTVETRRSATPRHLGPRSHNPISQPSCSWCGCFLWQCGHWPQHQRPQRGAWVLAAAASAGDGVSSALAIAASCPRQPDLSNPAAESRDGRRNSPGSASCGGNSDVDGGVRVLLPPGSARKATGDYAAANGVRKQQQQEQEQQQQGVDDAEAQPRRLHQQHSDSEHPDPPPGRRQRHSNSPAAPDGGHGLPPPPTRRAWDPGPGAAAQQSRRYDAGPGPPPPPLPPSPVLGSAEAPQLPLEDLRPLPLEPLTFPSLELGDGEGALEVELAHGDARAAAPAAPADGPAHSGAGTTVTVGAAVRAALRACRCLDDVEALLDGQVPLPLPSPPPPQQQPGQHQQLPALPIAESLNVPSLTAAVSALPRLPEALTIAGRRRLRQVLAGRLAPPILLAARRGELDAAGAAIMVSALAQLGPEVAIDPRVGRSDLVDALAATGLAACRLPLEPNGWRQQGQGNGPAPPGPTQPGPETRTHQHQPGVVRRYGHSPRSFSTLLYGLAKLGYRPDDVWLDRYLASSTPWLRAFPPRDLAEVAWALAALGYQPGEAWLAALLAAWPTGHSAGRPGTATLRGEHDGDGAESGAVTGVGRAAAAAAPGGRPADAHSLSLLLWALWRLGVAAPPAWLDGAVARCAFPSSASTATVTDPSGVDTATAAGNSTSPPSRSRGAAPFPAATCQSLALVSYCLARMGHTPPARVRQALLEAAGPLLQRGSSQDLVLLLVGVAHWPGGAAAAGGGGGAVTAAAVVPEHWLQQLCLALRQRLAGCSAQALVLSLSALSYLSYSPGPAWLDEHEAVLRPAISAGRLDGRAAARVAAAWARLRHRPGRNVVDRLLKMLVAAAAGGENLYGGGSSGAASATSPQRRRWLSARLFAEGLYGVAVLVAARRTALPTPPSRLTPQDLSSSTAPLLASIHLRALLAASQARLPYSYLDEALLHLRAWRLLRLAPPHQWMANLAAVARAKLHAAPPGVLMELLRLLAWNGWREMRGPAAAASAPPPAAAHVEHERHPHHDQHLYEQHQEYGGGVVGSGLPVSAALVGAVAERLSTALPELSVRQLGELAAALAALRVRPSRAWLAALLEELAARIQRGEGQELDLDPELDPLAEAGMDPSAGWRSPGAEAEEGPLHGPAAGLRALRAAAHLTAAVGDEELQRLAAQLAEVCRTAAAAPLQAGAAGTDACAGRAGRVQVDDARGDVPGAGTGRLRGGSGDARAAEPEPAIMAGVSPKARGP